MGARSSKGRRAHNQDGRLELTTDKTPKFTLKGQRHRAKCVKVYDGDTIHAVIMFHGEPCRFTCRMLGYDSPEMNAKAEDEKIRAIAARDALSGQIFERLITIECGGFDKYGRLLATCYTDDGRNINEWMLENGYGVPYPSRS